MKRRTKIVATLGPSVDSREMIGQLIDHGMNVARLNCSHGDWESKRRWIQWIRELSPKLAPVAILVDLQGPKFRIGIVEPGPVMLATGETTTIGMDGAIPVAQKEVLECLAVGDRVLIGDGDIQVLITEKLNSSPLFSALVQDGGKLSSKKGITIVGKSFKSPALTPDDLEDIQQALEAKVDFIALSYVRHAEDIRLLKWELEKSDHKVKVCAKIETPEACKELDEILEVVDMVMVARGDLGLQIDIEEVPRLQKRIIEHCGHVGKPVITATQMLESMMSNARPTRAEASDVFNAIIDGTDAVMLSGETAAGEFPLECIKVMSRLAVEAEEVLGTAIFERRTSHEPESQTDSIARAVVSLDLELEPTAIVSTSTSGQTPRLVSRFRPRSPILCASWSPETVAYMAVVWGVEALLIRSPDSTFRTLRFAIDAFKEVGKLEDEDFVILTGGVPPGKPGSTNLIMTQSVRPVD